MNTLSMRARCRPAPRVHRLDPRQESRFSLALILLMGLAILSVMAATRAVSDSDTQPVSAYSKQ